MARISYDEQTAAAYKTSRELPRDGLSEWRDAVRRHVRPAPGMTLVDVGAGTGQFATAFTEWFDIGVAAVEPSDAMRARIPRTPSIDVRKGTAEALPLSDDSADAAWISLVLHHIPDLDAAAYELRRVLRPGAPVLIRGGMSGGDYAGIENVRWFPETARTIEQVRETRPESLAGYLDQVDTLRHADTTLRALTDEEFLRGRERIRPAVEAGEPAERGNTLDLVVLR